MKNILIIEDELFPISALRKRESKLNYSSLTKDHVISKPKPKQILSETSQSGDKRIYNRKLSEKVKRWTLPESKKYEEFVKLNISILMSSNSKRTSKVFLSMADYISTKTASQCRSHHQKFFRRVLNLNKLLNGNDEKMRDYSFAKINKKFQIEQTSEKNEIEQLSTEDSNEQEIGNSKPLSLSQPKLLNNALNFSNQNISNSIQDSDDLNFLDCIEISNSVFNTNFFEDKFELYNQKIQRSNSDFPHQNRNFTWNSWDSQKKTHQTQSETNEYDNDIDFQLI